MAWSLDRQSDSFELACDWERSYAEAMQKMHKLTVPKQSSNLDRIVSRESKEEGNGKGNDHCTLKTRNKLLATLLWAPKIAKRTRSRIQDIANEGDEDEDDSESDGFFTLSFGIGDDADNDEEEEEEDNDEEQDDEEAENENAYKEEQITKRVLVFDEC